MKEREEWQSPKLVSLHSLGDTWECDCLQLAAIKDNNSGLPGATLASYTYLGLSQMVIEDLEEPQVKLDYFGGTSGIYTGFDRFNRIVDQRWHDYGASEDRDRFKYGYDRASSRTWKENAVSKDLGTPVYLDDFYTYDGTHRLKTFDRGQLDNQKSQIQNPKFSEDWTLDPLGNWSNYIEKTSGNTDLDQDRAVNRANEITDITETTGTAWPTPSHDRAGNMTSIPQPGDLANDYDLTWDAWNRLVKLEDDTTIIAEYSYDGQTHRIVRYVPGSPDSYQHFYYNPSWQVLETRESSMSTVPTTAQYQYVWSLRYIDAPILRDDIAADPDDRIYYLGDANFNITTLIDTNGTALERNVYTPYGVLTIYDAAWSVTRTASQYGNVYTFTGRRLDEEMGLYYFRARMYDSTLGRFISRDPLIYVDGMSSYQAHFVPHSRDPSGQQAANRACIMENGKRKITFWKLVHVGVSSTINFPNPGPNTVVKGEEQAKILTCLYERKVETTYRCHPDCFKPPRQFPKNVCVETCTQLGTATTAPRASKPVFVEGVSIGWWPQGVPGASITLFTGWVEDVDGKNAESACKFVGQQFIKNEGPKVWNVFTPGFEEWERPACKGNCPK